MVSSDAPSMLKSANMEVSLRVRKGAWTEEEDNLLRKCIEAHGEGKWHQVPQRAGLNRCRKSCRLRWLNYLKPNIKRGEFKVDEVDLMIRLQKLLGNRWSLIAGRLPGRTANDVKNYWNTHLKKKVAISSSSNPKKQDKAYVDQETSKITKTNIIKPKPRSFSKNLRLSSGNNDKGSLLINTEQKHRDSSAMPSPPLSDIASMWWEDLLNDEEINETNVSCTGEDSGEKPFSSFLGDNFPEQGRVGDIFFEQDQCFGDDFSFDVELWNFLDT